MIVILQPLIYNQGLTVDGRMCFTHDPRHLLLRVMSSMRTSEPVWSIAALIRQMVEEWVSRCDIIRQHGQHIVYWSPPLLLPGASCPVLYCFRILIFRELDSEACPEHCSRTLFWRRGAFTVTWVKMLFPNLTLSSKFVCWPFPFPSSTKHYKSTKLAFRT
jgi:hypothetical protein